MWAVDFRLFILRPVSLLSPVRMGLLAVSLLPTITGLEYLFERLLGDFPSMCFLKGHAD